MIMVVDPVAADTELVAGALSCPTCDQPLRAWGYARRRVVRGPDGPLSLRPRRARCRRCQTTHVLLPAQILHRRCASVDVIGTALLASLSGQGHRTIAEVLALPADTVRGWLRRARSNSEWLRQQGTIWAYQLDSELPPLQDQPTALGRALDALATAAAAARRWAFLVPPWQLIAAFTAGHLLSPRHRSD